MVANDRGSPHARSEAEGVRVANAPRRQPQVELNRFAVEKEIDSPTISSLIAILSADLHVVNE